MLEPEAAPPSALRCLPVADRPRERLLRLGADKLSSSELVAILVGNGRRGANALVIGHELVSRHGLDGLARASVQELTTTPGCGVVTACQLKAALELGRRVALQAPRVAVRIGSPADAARLLAPEMSLLEQEHLRVMLLTIKNQLMAIHEVYKGSVSASLVRVGEVFREAVRCNSPTIIVAHNHPSGDPDPSAEDVQITQQIVAAGRLLGIEVLDHIVVGHQRWVSLRERGLGFS